MIELTTPAERAALLPGGSRGLFLVLFWRSSDPACRAARARVDGAGWPACFRVVAVDLDRAADVATWFRIDDVPILAVVTDGAMLDIETDLGSAARQRLAECGRWQYDRLIRAADGV